jgi:ABC-type polar amino acid transport system ATPase subunit
MVVPLNSPLQGIAAERFLSLARSLSLMGDRFSEFDSRKLLDDEIQWCRSLLNGDQTAYEASVRVLVDLVRLGWQVVEQGYGIELVASPPRLSALTTEQIQVEKRKTRTLFEPLVEAQYSDPGVLAFFERMENPKASSKKKPITLLIAEGEELHNRIRISGIDAIQPYLQLVESEETDKFTGHQLREIWRYLRFTWSIPQFPTPGRQLLYLVRDAGHPCHAVMGIISLNNCALQMGTSRETYLGWNLVSLKSRLLYAAEVAPDQLDSEFDWFNQQITAALADVESEGLISQDDIERPTPEIVSGLRRRAKDFDLLRDETLRYFASERSGVEISSSAAEVEDSMYPHPPISEDMLNLEGKPSTRPQLQKARKHLIARKRSALLAELLHARMVLRDFKQGLISAEELAATLENEEVQVALNTVLAALKSRYAGINMLEISTCGAIQPYNYLLGGKLASLLLFSPQIAADYRRIYERPSIIASQMKNAPVQRSNELVYLGTTSLYAQGSSQYERLKLPAGLIAPDQTELRFVKVGKTSGYGTLQFPAHTRDAVERHLMSVQRFQDVNSIFGEGASPKLRKLVAGLREIGFPPDSLMRHNRPRLIYSAALCPEARDFLSARPCKLPSYITNPERFRDATLDIARFWKSRWLASRLKHQPSLTALLSERPFKVSERVPSQQHNESVTPKRPAKTKAKPATATFWHHLAASGPKVASDALTAKELDCIHIVTPVETFLRAQVRDGLSIFLTGNAGDGKTHLLRRLNKDLVDAGAVVIEDATADMRHEDVSPVLDKWRKAVADGRQFCIAINEYPLFRLRKAAEDFLPDLANEIARQNAQRLVYGTEKTTEDALQNLLVVDLSLRNPLSPQFVSACLDKLLSDDAILAATKHDLTLADNLTKLSDKRVRGRLLSLFQRLATRGHRATVRELWIILARIVVGYRADLTTALGEGMQHSYAECLFQQDSRFPLFQALRECDPAFNSHPIWDPRLEEGDRMASTGWWTSKPVIRATTRLDRQDFLTLKRLFYFEHEQGDKAFEFEATSLSRFTDLLNKGGANDALTRSSVIKAINRAYCPVAFPGINESLYLWNGHRFHEQPSDVFLANARIPADKLSLNQPRLPRRVVTAFPEYLPDHLALIANNADSVSLRIDCGLFETLSKLENGLPRKLVADRDIFRLEQFIDELNSRAATNERRIMSANLKRRELIEVHLTTDGKRYERIIKP